MVTFASSDTYYSALTICSELKKAGFIAYFAGGVVRDALLGRNVCDDIDIATNASPEQVCTLFPSTVPVGAKFGVIIVVQRGIPFEVATFRSDYGISDGRHPENIEFTTAENDALRRDFTVNGLFYDPESKDIIDYVGGREDLEKGILRAIGIPTERFSEDYLRMLRAIRFATRLHFTIEEYTWNALCNCSNKIKGISVERIFAELTKMFCLPNAMQALDLLDASGLLVQVLPDVAALKGVKQPEAFHPEGDVFEHTRIAMEIMGNTKTITPILAWSVLLHDIGKPSTKKITDRIRFNNHDQVGMVLTKKILREFHASKAVIDDVCACVGNHMNFMHVQKMRLGTLKKFLSRPTIGVELELHRIDCLASHGNCENYTFLKEKLSAIEKETLQPLPLLRGRDLIELGFKEGPVIGEILLDVYERQLEEDIKSREEAFNYIRCNYSASRNGKT